MDKTELTAKITVCIMATACFAASLSFVNSFHQTLSPDLLGSGDYRFYLKCCFSTPTQEHVIVPLFLRVLNIVLQNPQLTVLSMMVVSYFLVYFLTFLLTAQLTKRFYTGLISVSIALGFGFLRGSGGFLSPTALKNRFAIIFLLISYFFLLKLKNKPTTTKLALFLTFAFLTALTHSLPIFLLLETLMVFLIYKTYNGEREKRVFLVAVPALAFATFVALTFSGKLIKFADLFQNFVFNLPATFILNCTFAYIPYIAIFQWALITFSISLAYKQKLNPFFVSLLLNAGTLMFLGTKSLTHYSYSSRFHENLLPFLAIILGYITSFAIDLFSKKEEKTIK